MGEFPAGAVNRAVSSHRPVNQRPLPVLGAAHNTISSRHSTKSSGTWTSRPRFTLFPVTSGLRLMIGGSAGQRDRHSYTRPGAQGHPARPAAAGPGHARLRALAPADRAESKGSGHQRRPGRRLHRPRRHGPGPSPARRGAAGADDRWPVEKRQDTGSVHRALGGGPGSGGQVLSGERGVNVTGSCRQHGFESITGDRVTVLQTFEWVMEL